MDWEKRAMLATALAFLFLIAYQYVMSKMYPAPAEKAPAEVEEKTPIKAQKPRENIPKLGSDKMGSQVERGVQLVFKNKLYRISIDTGAGGVSSFRLLKYLTELPPAGVPVELIPEGTEPLPLTPFLLKDGKIINPGPFKYTVNDETWPREISLYSVKKDYAFVEWWRLEPDTYAFKVSYTVANLSEKPMNLAVEVMLARRAGKSSMYSFSGLMSFNGRSLKKIEIKHLKEEITLPSDIHWLSIADKYFMTALIPELIPGMISKARRDNGLIQALVYFPETILQEGQKVIFNVKAYFGPRHDVDLKKAGSNLEKALDLGILTGPIMKLLKLFYSFTGNYGLAIILLSILVKILFWPLTHISFKSMKKMKEVQPILEELKKKYGDDKEKLAMETMEVYRKYKVNPFSGCLPLIIQLPVFIALYKALLNAIELRHAPFVWWIKDLSSPDLLFTLNLQIFSLPVRLLPLLMGITTYVQQKLTPSAGQDPMQSKLMNYMSLIFVVLFWNFPSGLMIYWVVQNLLSLVQQIQIMRSR